MDNTREFVEKVHDTQEKDQQNRKRQGRGHDGENAGKKLPGKQHGSNK